MTKSRITVTADVWRTYKQTIAKHPPETVALLGGNLAEPYRISEFKFLPPRMGTNGYDASRVHINVDADVMNWIIDKEWKPNGLYMLGIWHSHPNGSARPSVGDPASNQGDLSFAANCLAHDDSPGRNWATFLMPITTFAADGSDTVHGWVLQRGSSTPLSVPVIVESAQAARVETQPALDLTPARVALARSVAHATLARELLAQHGVEMSAVRNDDSLSDSDREAILRDLDMLRSSEARDLRRRRHPVSLALGLGEEPPLQESQVQRQIDTAIAALRAPSLHAETRSTNHSIGSATTSGRWSMHDPDNPFRPFLSPPAP